MCCVVCWLEMQKVCVGRDHVTCRVVVYMQFTVLVLLVRSSVFVGSRQKGSWTTIPLGAIPGWSEKFVIPKLQFSEVRAGRR